MPNGQRDPFFVEFDFVRGPCVLTLGVAEFYSWGAVDIDGLHDEIICFDAEVVGKGGPPTEGDVDTPLEIVGQFKYFVDI